MLTENVRGIIRRSFFLFAVLLAFAGTAAAQATIFVVDFDRTGTPGTSTVSTIDPMTGLPVETPMATGAFSNPCTFENVDVTGSSTISTQQSLDRFGNLKVSVGVSSKGMGLGWDPLAGPGAYSGNNYSFSETQNFDFRVAAGTLVNGFESDFSDKFSLKGAKSLDNWMVRAHFKIKVSADGIVQVFLVQTTQGDGCKG